MKRLVFLLVIATAVTSCTKEPFRQAGRGDKKTIGVNVSGCNYVMTRSESGDGELFDSFVVDSIGDQVLKIDGYVSDSCPEGWGADTRGSIITTTGISKFWMTAYGNADWHDNATNTDYSANSKYFEAKVVTKDSGTGAWSIANSPTWINDIGMTFWSWSGFLSPAPGPDPVDDDPTDNKATFSYTNNGTQDLIYAFNREKRKFDSKGNITEGSGTYKSGSKDAMDIKFYHALAAVRFDVSGLKRNGLTIKSIVFKGVVNYADCEITVGTATTDNPFPLSFDWTPKTGTSNKADFTVALASTDFTETADGIANALMPMSSSKFLFLIPQDVQGKDITVELTFTNASGTDKTLTASLNHATPWDAGKYYTYRLTCGSVDLAFTGTSPTVNVKNTGSAKAFLRVAIVGNWCMNLSGSLYPVSECPTSDITFTTLHNTTDDSITGAGGHWVLNTSDGYWYYSKPVDPGVEVPLFAGYSANSSATHPAGTSLKLTVVGQAVAAGSETNWAGAATVSN